jgi:hypothetical protein
MEEQQQQRHTERARERKRDFSQQSLLVHKEVRSGEVNSVIVRSSNGEELAAERERERRNFVRVHLVNLVWR